MTSPSPTAHPVTEPDPRSRDAGDTLIELLIAMTIISIAVIGLMGGLLGGIASSSTHRSLATLDSVIKSFAESSKFAIQQNAGGVPLYRQCASSYTYASAPYPRTGGNGTTVTVFATGLTGSAAPTVTLQQVSSGAIVPSPTVSNISTTPPDSTYHNDTVTFTLTGGSTTSASFQINVTDGNTASSATPITYALNSSSGTSNEVSLMSVQVTSITYWNGAGFVGACPGYTTATLGQDIQDLTIIGSVKGASDQLDMVVADPNHPVSTNVTVSSTPAVTVYPFQSLQFATTVQPPSTLAPTPSGHVTYNISNATGQCAPGTQVNVAQIGTTNSASASCSFTAGQGGTAYSGTATYAGDTFYSSSTSPSYSINVSSIPFSSATVSGPSGAQTDGTSLTYTATFTPSQFYAGAPAESGTVTWDFGSGAPAALRTCAAPNIPNQSVNAANNVLTATCTIVAVLPGTYTPVATYPNTDPNYATTSTTNNLTATVAGPNNATTTAVTSTPANPAPGDTITFTATVSGNPALPGVAPGGTVKWTFSNNSPGAPSCNDSTLTPGTTSSMATCMVPNAALGTYKITAQYQPDTSQNYAGSTSPQYSTTVNSPPPAMTVSGAKNGPSAGPTVSFTTTVTGTNSKAATGSVTWTVTASSGPNPTCSIATGNAAHGFTSTCSFTGTPGVTYSASSTYSGDGNYGDESMASSNSVTA